MTGCDPSPMISHMITCYMYSCNQSIDPGVVMAEGSRTKWEAVTSLPPLSGFLFLPLKSVPSMMPSVTKPHSQAALTRANAVLLGLSASKL